MVVHAYYPKTQEREARDRIVSVHAQPHRECSWTLNHTGSLKPEWPPWNYLNFPAKRTQLPYRYRVYDTLTSSSQNTNQCNYFYYLFKNTPDKTTKNKTLRDGGGHMAPLQSQHWRGNEHETETSSHKQVNKTPLGLVAHTFTLSILLKEAGDF